MRQFGELEAVIMDRLWAWGRPALVREMVDDLRRDRALAYTTVMTVMENLYRKGWLRRERDARAWRYELTGSRSAYTAALMNEALGTSPDRRTVLAAGATDAVQRIHRLLRPAEPLGGLRRQLLRALAAGLVRLPVVLALAPAVLALALGRVPSNPM